MTRSSLVVMVFSLLKTVRYLGVSVRSRHRANSNSDATAGPYVNNYKSLFNLELLR